ncbi:glycosyltransferase family 2 protein [uncultured Haemophilus sp.]|uniref:glycosyltransferase family 2 protein n=1 Tax=Haemophilus sp. SZY H52 TaxID=3042471 RepID=UPI002620A2E8|nr:glycosyltransferase family 2 protein [uncultured Haemophilus sp.]
MNTPLISIIMPMYNSEKYLKEAIYSCLNQTYKNIELIIIDDGSTDTSVDIVKDIMLVDSRVILLFSGKNNGPAIARNIGLDKAKGEYVTFLDSDDFIDKNKLERQIQYMLANNLIMTHGCYSFSDLSGNIIKKITTSEFVDYDILLKGNQFKIMTVLINRDVIKNIRFPQVKHEDYAFFLDCLKITKKSFLYSHSIDSHVRIGRASVSSNKIKSALWTFNIYFNYEKLGLIKSLYCFVNYAFNAFLKHKM